MTLFGKHFEFCLSMYLKLFKIFLACHKQKNVCQARVCVVAKPTNVVLVKQTFKCLPNNVCPFGRGLIKNIDKQNVLVKQNFKCLPSNICPFGQGLITNIDKQNVLLKQCLSWWPNVQAYLTSKIQNVCQTMSFCLAGALDFQFFLTKELKRPIIAHLPIYLS